MNFVPKSISTLNHATCLPTVREWLKLKCYSKMLFYKILGFIFVGLAALGIFLPLLPTTPFLLLAAGCFAKSSDKWHQWLLSNRTFGPIIKNWYENKCLSYLTKIVAISSIIIFGSTSILFAVNNIYLRLFGTLTILTGLYFVSRIKVCKSTTN